MFAPNFGGIDGSGEAAAATLKNHRLHHWPPAAGCGGQPFFELRAELTCLSKLFKALNNKVEKMAGFTNYGSRMPNAVPSIS